MNQQQAMACFRYYQALESLGIHRWNHDDIQKLLGVSSSSSILRENNISLSIEKELIEAARHSEPFPINRIGILSVSLKERINLTGREIAIMKHLFNE